MSCQICGHETIEKISLYKHIWLKCSECGNAKKIKRERYALQFIANLSIFTVLLKNIPKVRAIHNLVKNLGKNEEGIDLYDHYLQDGIVTSHGSPWEGHSAKLLEEIKSNITHDTKSMTVLDISGGPGYVINELRENFSSVSVTEFSPTTVHRMSKLLNLRSHLYNFNSMQLKEVTKQKYDLILSRHALNFVDDINDFAFQLSKSVNKDGFLYLSFVTTNVQAMVRWQMEDYIYNYLFDCDYLSKIFSDFGFQEVHRETIKGPHFLEKKSIFKPIFLTTIFINKLSKIFKEDPTTKSAMIIFRKQ